METPTKITELLLDITDFLLRNLFGLLSFLVGFIYQLYQMTGRKNTLTKVQCMLSVLMWFVSGIAIVIALSEMHLNQLFYGLACWATPIVIKPFADSIASHASPISEKILTSFEKAIEKYTKNKTDETTE